MNFSEAVKQAMCKLDLKRSDIAKASGYSYQYISDLLSGDRRWNEESINKVCEVLDLKIEIKSEGSEVEDETPSAD